MIRKPYFVNHTPAPVPNLRITLDVLPNGSIQFNANRPLPMLSIISIFSGLVKECADTLVRQSAGIIQVPEDKPTTVPENEAETIPVVEGE